MNVLVERNTIIPTRRKGIFTTSIDDQTRAVIKIYEGERVLTRDNVLLATLVLEGTLPFCAFFLFIGLPPGPAGSIKIEIFIEVDVDGIPTITAIEDSTQIFVFHRVNQSKPATFPNPELTCCRH